MIFTSVRRSATNLGQARDHDELPSGMDLAAPVGGDKGGEERAAKPREPCSIGET